MTEDAGQDGPPAEPRQEQPEPVAAQTREAWTAVTSLGPVVMHLTDAEAERWAMGPNKLLTLKNQDGTVRAYVLDAGIMHMARGEASQIATPEHNGRLRLVR